MQIVQPNASDVVGILAALQAYPLGGILLLLFALVGVLALWVYKQEPSNRKRRKTLDPS